MSSDHPITIDPRVEAVAEALRDREDGSTGWCNTTAHHQNFLRMEAARLLIVADAAVAEVRKDPAVKPQHVIIIGQRTLRLLAQWEPVTVTSYDESCLITFIRSSEYPHEAVLAATEPGEGQTP